MKNLDDFNVYEPGAIIQRNGREYTYINNLLFYVRRVSRSVINREISDIILNGKTLEDVYTDPSPAKLNKYNLWRNWSDQIRNLYNFSIKEITTKDYAMAGYFDLQLEKQATILIRPGKYLSDACILSLEEV